MNVKFLTTNFYHVCISRTWDAGICHTFNPERETPSFLENMISLYLGLEEYLTFYNLLAFHVYLHEKGQFWPRSDLEMVTHMEIQKNQEKSIAFQIEKFSKVSSEITHHVALIVSFL